MVKKNVSSILPSSMVAVFKNNTPLQARLLAKQFFGLRIEASGIVDSIDDTVYGSYITLNFHNVKDDTFISANFDRPISQELMVLDKGDHIKLQGDVFNVAEGIVVLDHCTLVSEGVSESTLKENKESFLEKFFWQIFTIVGTILAGLILYKIFRIG